MFTIAEVHLPVPLTRVEDLARNPEPMMEMIGLYMVARSQESFESQGRPEGSWRERAVPNIPGIIRDYYEGRDGPQDKRWKARPALVDEGNLRASIAHEVKGNAVEIGSNLEYAAKHQFGDDTNETDAITGDFQVWLEEWMQEAVGAVAYLGAEATDHIRAGLNADLGWMLQPRYVGKKLPWPVPARPFVDVLDEDMVEIREIMLDHLTPRVA